MLQIVFSIFWLSYNNWYAVGPTFVSSLELSAHPRNNDQFFFIGITLEDVHLDWLKCFLSLTFRGVLILILTGFMLSFSPFLDPTRMPMSTVSFLKQPGPGITCQQSFELRSKLLYV